MSGLKNIGKKDEAKKPSKSFSSQGDSPVEMTPKDISPKHAAWKDRTERKITSDDTEEKVDALLDEASELSFPASDPIAVSSITKLVKPSEGEKEEADQDKSGEAARKSKK
jgi:hypothetical protein